MSKKARTQASFSQRQLLEFDGSLARKLRFHIFNSWKLKEASHESFVVTHHGCDLNVRICTKHCFFPVSGASGAVKSKPACAGAGIAALAWKCSRICARSGTDGSRRLFLFFDDAVLLCFAYVETLSALELLRQRQRHVGTSSTLQI